MPPHAAAALLSAAAAPGAVPTVPLRNAADAGMEMPVTGLGTGGYNSPPEEVWNDTTAKGAVAAWLRAGGRFIDCALGYNDQVGVGDAVAASGVPRSSLFITSKVDPMRHPDPYNATLRQFDTILEQLRTGYVDLLLTHWPNTNSTGGLTPTQHRQEVWRALTKVWRSGGARAVGVSNYEVQHLQDIEALGGPLPAVNQVEYHLYWHEDALVDYCKERGITFNAYGPLGTPDVVKAKHFWSPISLEHPVVRLVAANHHGATAAQVIQAWIRQQGIVTNPRTRDPAHMRENLAAYRLQLSADEMAALSSGARIPNCTNSSYGPNDPICKICPDARVIL